MRLRILSCFIYIFFITGCSGGGGTDSEQTGRSGSKNANYGCDGSCTNFNLTASDVHLIVNQAVNAATSLGVAATIAVTDRVGNVLAVYSMPGAAETTVINGQIGAVGGLEGVAVPSTIAAISKAGTGAYLSSQGNAFSTRTASQIIQEHFNPGEQYQAGGPLFGVQFSQLICSDVTTINPALLSGVSSGGKFQAAGLVGPRPLPLGLSADPGGIPLYKLGDLVGGIGVELDGSYTLDRSTSDIDDSVEERIALMAGRGGFEFPSERSGNVIFVAGKSLRTADLNYDNLQPLSEILTDLDPTGLTAVPLYFDGVIKDGSIFGTPASGISRTSRAGLSAAILTDSNGNARFPTHSGKALAGGAELQVNEVEALLDSALLTAFRTRAAIRQPGDSQAHVSIWVTDTEGNVLGMTRTADGPIFGLDVALQKARTAAFFSSTDVIEKISAAQAADGFGDYAGALSSFFGANVFSKGTAFSVRAIGNLARPFFLDGIDGTEPGPLSLPFPGTAAGKSWSPFNTGFELDLVAVRTLAPLLGANSLSSSCANPTVFGSRLKNGIQIFAGGVPLYRGHTLIGGIGVSGDGIDHDDQISFYGATRPGLDASSHSDRGDPVLGFNAPLEIRSDTLVLPQGRLRYVNCPEAPFRGENVQKICTGL